MHCLTAAAQDDGVARTQPQGRSIRRHIGPAFVNDAKHADGHADARHLQTIGLRAAVDDLTDGVRQHSNLFHRRSHGRDARVVEFQPIQHGGGQASRRPCRHVDGIRRENIRRLVTQRLSRSFQRLGLGRIIRRRQLPRCSARFGGNRCHQGLIIGHMFNP